MMTNDEGNGDNSGGRGDCHGEVDGDGDMLNMSNTNHNMQCRVVYIIHKQ